jgi:very-short-patch-repair endonuclease
MYQCEKCGKEFDNGKKLGGHITSCGKIRIKRGPSKHKFFTDKKELECSFCKSVKYGENSLKQHEARCKENPNRTLKGGFIAYNEKRKETGIKGENQFTKAERLGIEKPLILEETRKKMGLGNRGKKITAQSREKLIVSMKLAHKEGRAWNIGKSRWNNEPSYPEKFFMKVIENEFEDKNYSREFPVGNFSIDFAWIDKKIAIEIDGDQHQRFQEIKERDKRKNKVLTEKGWRILRISWKDLYNESKKYISLAKEFVNQNVEIS